MEEIKKYSKVVINETGEHGYITNIVKENDEEVYDICSDGFSSWLNISDFTVLSPPTVLAKMECENIFSIKKDADNFIFIEMCNEYFSATLSKDEMIKLIDELQELVK